MSRRRWLAVVVASTLVVAACAAKTPTARPEVPLEVVSSAHARSEGVDTWSVFCVPAGTTPFHLANATYWREVQVGEQGPDGPDGYWAQRRPCPAGRVLHESLTQSG